MSRDFVSPREIVVASDLTDTDILLPHAIAQAHANSSRITIVHAVGNTSPGSPARVPGRAGDDVPTAQAVLGQMASSLKDEGIDCSIVARAGLALTVVREEIRRIGAGRLIIGTHSHGHAGQAMIGSVANALLQTAEIPVFVIGPDVANPAEYVRPRRILHPVALSGQYRETAELASEIAAFYQAKLTLLHLMTPATATGCYATEITSRNLRELEALRSSSTVHPDVVVKYGEVVTEILSAAASCNADWIIMSYSHNFPWWSMQNNDAYQVIAESPCPVLTLHSRILAQMHHGSELTAQSA